MTCEDMTEGNAHHPVCKHDPAKRSPELHRPCDCMQNAGKRQSVQTDVYRPPTENGSAPKRACAPLTCWKCAQPSCGAACVQARAVLAAASQRQTDAVDRRAAKEAAPPADPSDAPDDGEQQEARSQGDTDDEEDDAQDGQDEEDGQPVWFAVMALMQDHMHVHGYGHAGATEADVTSFAADLVMQGFAGYLVDFIPEDGASAEAIFRTVLSEFVARERVPDFVFEPSIDVDDLPVGWVSLWRRMRESEMYEQGARAVHSLALPHPRPP